MSAASPWRGVPAIGIMALLGLALAGPWVLGEFPLVLAGLSTAVSQICHQDPNRALLIEGTPSLLCARCLGSLAGGAAVLLAPVQLSKRRTLALLAIGGVAWLAEAGSGPWPAEARLLAGTVIGFALAAPLAEAWKPRMLC